MIKPHPCGSAYGIVYKCDCCGDCLTDAPWFMKSVKVPQFSSAELSFFNRLKKENVHLCKTCYDSCWKKFTDEMIDLRRRHWMEEKSKRK